MANKAKTVVLATIAAFLACIASYASETTKLASYRISPKSLSDCRMGVWMSNFSLVKQYAIDNGLPFFAMWTNGEQCSHCTKFEGCLNSQAFREWMAESGIVFWFGYNKDTSVDDKDNGNGWKFCYSNQSLYPIIRFYWKAKKGTVLADRTVMEKDGVVIDKYTMGDTLDNRLKSSEGGAEKTLNNTKSAFKKYVPMVNNYYHPTSAFSAPGKWTYDLAGAKAYASQNNRFFIIVHTCLDNSNSACNDAAASVFSTQAFYQWAYSNQIALVLSDTCTPNSTCTEVQQLYNNDGKNWSRIPQMLVIDGKDGVTCLARADVAKSIVNGLHGAQNGYPPYGFIFEPFDAFTAIEWISYALGCLAAEVQPSSSVQAYNQAEIQAQEVIPDEGDMQELSINGIYKDYGMLHLIATNYWKGSYASAKYKTTRQWFKFKNAVFGTKYELNLPSFDDKQNILALCVYSSIADAQQVKTNDYQSAISNASYVAASSSLAHGFSFIPSTGNEDYAYILFTIHEPAMNYMNTAAYEPLDAKCTFTLKKVDADTPKGFSFAKRVWLGHEGMTNKIAVIRDNANEDAVVVFQTKEVASMKPSPEIIYSRYDQAIEHEDYFFVDANGAAKNGHSVQFKTGIFTNFIYVLNARGKANEHNANKAFGITLHVDSSDSTMPQCIEAIATIEDIDSE